jgi:hypothetical protein
MIRCIPVDGSEAFEVENDSRAMWLFESRRFDDLASELYSYVEVDVGEVRCRIESWRERAERLEKELEALRCQNALDAIDKRRESEHG